MAGFLGLVHPLLAGHADFLLPGNWLGYTGRVKREETGDVPVSKFPACKVTVTLKVTVTFFNYFTKFRSTVCRMPPLR